MLDIAIGILRFFLFQLDPDDRTNNEKIIMCACMRTYAQTPLHLPPVFHGDPKGKQSIIGSIWSPAPCLSHNGGLNKCVLSQWNHICLIILLRTEDSYQVLVSLKPVSRALKSDFYSLVFHLQRWCLVSIFSARPVIEADERMIRQTQTILALKQLTVLGRGMQIVIKWCNDEVS